MKNVLAIVALSLALSLSACTKKEAAPEGGEQVESTTPPADTATPPPAEEAPKEGEAATPPPAETAPAGEHAH